MTNTSTVLRMPPTDSFYIRESGRTDYIVIGLWWGAGLGLTRQALTRDPESVSPMACLSR
jgi:hypothetical protein